jgi:hypothetical protein
MASRFERDKEQAAREAQTAAQTEAFQRFLEVKHPEIRFSIALVKEIREYMEEAFLTAGNEDFEYALEGIDTRYMSQHVPTVVEENARRRSLSMQELQKLARQESSPLPQPDVLPQFYVPLGKKRPVELTADAIRRAGTRTGEISIADLKFLIRRYSSTEVNKRLGVTPKAQPGYAKSLDI